MATKTLFVDAASLAYRAYHAVPEIRADDGTLVNAAYGFLNFMSRLVPDRKPSRMHVALDADWRPQFRVDAIPSYKSHRVAGPDDPPDPVDPQMKIIVEMLEAFGISVAAAEGYEAEDVIATLVARTDDSVEIVTGDRDLFQLVRDPNVQVLYTLRGVTELAHVDEAVRRYSADYLIAARKVVLMPRDAPVTSGEGTLPRTPAHPERVLALAKRYALEGAAKRLVEALAA